MKNINLIITATLLIAGIQLSAKECREHTSNRGVTNQSVQQLAKYLELKPNTALTLTGSDCVVELSFNGKKVSLLGRYTNDDTKVASEQFEEIDYQASLNDLIFVTSNTELEQCDYGDNNESFTISMLKSSHNYPQQKFASVEIHKENGKIESIHMLTISYTMANGMKPWDNLVICQNIK